MHPEQDDTLPPGSSILAFLEQQRVLAITRDTNEETGKITWHFREKCDGFYAASLTTADVERLALELLTLVGSEKKPVTFFNAFGELKGVALVPGDPRPRP